MPLPLSPNSGLGMNVTVRPAARAVFLTMYLYAINVSAIASSGRNRMSISAWPAVPTSWCCISTSMPHLIRFVTISDRRSV